MSSDTPTSTTPPNILIVQVDQLAARYLGCYGHPLVRSPNIDRLAERSVIFDAAYCNYPLCSPSRASMLSGRLPFAIDQWDNGAEFSAEIPTIAHYLTAAGYSTTLCGKMHFVGPDQLHGYEQRLVTDIYPSDFAWTTDWSHVFRPGGGIRVRNVVEAGWCLRSLQMDFDEEVEHLARQALFDLARNREGKPFFLTVSFSHPHPPYVAPKAYWDLYADEDIDMPVVAPMRREELDPFNSARWEMMGHQHYELTEQHTRSARHAYYAMITYVDALIGSVLDALEATGLADGTVIVFTSDHGEMLGERGMWLKDNFLEDSVRVPLMIAGPDIAPRRSRAVVSLVDLMPTLLELSGTGVAPVEPVEGRSLVPLIGTDRDDWDGVAMIDFAGGGHDRVARAVRRSRYKCIAAHGLASQLFDLEADPHELRDLADDPAHADTLADLEAEVARSWAPDELDERVRASQRRRLLIQQAADASGRYPNWSAVVREGDAERFVRGRASSFYAKAKFRFPMTEPADEPECD
jgi:choline-sulfatase